MARSQNGLSEAPLEIWAIVIEFLPVKDVRSLQKTCWKAYHCALRSAWAEVAVGRRPDPQLDGGIASLKSLILTLIHKPAVRPFVRSAAFEWDCDWTRSTSDYAVVRSQRQQIWGKADLLAINKAVDSLSFCLPDVVLLKRELKKGNPDALVALGLALLPDIHCLTLGERFWACDSLCVAPLLVEISERWRTNGIAPLFSNLKTFRGCDDYNKRGSEHGRGFWPSFSALMGLFYLPKLQHLSTIIANPWYWNWPNGQIPKSSITVLSLPDSEIKVHWLSKILEACPRLEKLHYEASLPFTDPWDYSWTEATRKGIFWEQQYGTRNNVHPDWTTVGNVMGTYGRPIDLSEFVSVLRKVEPTLRELRFGVRHILYTDRKERDTPEDLCIGDMTGLRSFSKLEVLDCPISVLLLADDELVDLHEVVPLNLKKLYFGESHDYTKQMWRDEDAALAVFDRYMNCNSRPSDLHVVTIEWPVWEPSEAKQSYLQNMVTLCRENNIAYSLKQNFWDRSADSIWSPSSLSSPYSRNSTLADLEDKWQESIMYSRYYDDEDWRLPLSEWEIRYGATIHPQAWVGVRRKIEERRAKQEAWEEEDHASNAHMLEENTVPGETSSFDVFGWDAEWREH